MAKVKEIKTLPPKVKIVSESDEKPEEEKGKGEEPAIRATPVHVESTPAPKESSPLMTEAPRTIEGAAAGVTTRARPTEEVNEAEARPYENARIRENEQRRYQGQEQQRGPTMRTVSVDSTDNPLLRRDVARPRQMESENSDPDNRGYQLTENVLTEEQKLEHKRRRNWF